MGCFYFLASFLFTSCLVLGAEPPTKYVLKGTGESLKPTFSGQPNSILWKHNGNKVVEFDSREEQVYGAYKNRITLDWVSAELEITGLKLEDRGLYEVEVDINNMLHLSEFKLEVIDKVAMPTISCELNKDGGSDVSEVRATLLCSADPTPPESMMKFEWRARGKSQPGHKFNISLGDERDNEEYSCSVSNPVSSETATFTAKDCYHDNSSVAVAVSLAVVGLIVLVLIIIFCKKRQKACFAKGQQDDEEKQTEGSDKKKAQGGETRPLLTETLPSDQRLSVSYSPEPVVDTEPRKGFVKKAIHNIEKGKKPQQPQSITETLSPPASPFGNLISPSLHADFDRGDTDADVMNLSGEEKISQPEHSNSEETKEPECVGLSDESEQPEKNQGGGEEASPVPPTDQTSPDDKLSQDEDLKDPAGGQKNGSDSEEVNKDTQDESVSQTDSSACFAKGQQDDEEKQTEAAASSHQDQAPAAASSHQDQAPTAASSHQNQAPAAASSHQDQAPTAASSHQDQAPTAASSHQDQAQTAASSHQDQAQTAASSHQDQAPTAASSHQDQAPTAASSHQDQAPTAASSHQDQAQTAASSHQDQAQTAASSHQDQAPTAASSHQDQAPTAASSHQDQAQTAPPGPGSNSSQLPQQPTVGAANTTLTFGHIKKSAEQ
nr:uncharacterized protein LOC110003312 [Labrus bergylta]